MNRLEFFEGLPAMPQVYRQRIHWAYDTAKMWHVQQMRDGGERYFEHVRRAAQVVIDLGHSDPDLIIVLILHDLLEDTYYPWSMLEQNFGPTVARKVLTLSKTYGLEDPLTGRLIPLPKRSKEEYFGAIQRGGRDVVIAKGADRYDNLTDLVDPPQDSEWYSPQRRLDKVTETRQWIIPLVEQHEPRLAAMLRARCDVIQIKAMHASGGR